MKPRLIILYGNASKDRSSKVQQLVDGKLTCGYRDYAQHYGCIAYLVPVNNIKKSWEYVFPEGRGIVEFCRNYPDAIVWSVKLGNSLKNSILDQIKNRKLYYSCCSRNIVNNCCHISLVDTVDRLPKSSSNVRLWIKGKDPEFWKPVSEQKIYDYVVVGRPKPSKNQKLFVKQLARECPHTRTVLWIGGGEGRKLIGNHQLVSTPLLPPNRVRDLMCLARVGVLFTQYEDEGFPQSLLELTMCGVPVIYSTDGPYNSAYFSPHSAIRTTKRNLIKDAENMLKLADPVTCRSYAINNYTLLSSFEMLCKIAEEIKL